MEFVIALMTIPALRSLLSSHSTLAVWHRLRRRNFRSKGDKLYDLRRVLVFLGIRQPRLSLTVEGLGRCVTGYARDLAK